MTKSIMEISQGPREYKWWRASREGWWSGWLPGWGEIGEGQRVAQRNKAKALESAGTLERVQPFHGSQQSRWRLAGLPGRIGVSHGAQKRGEGAGRRASHARNVEALAKSTHASASRRRERGRGRFPQFAWGRWAFGRSASEWEERDEGGTTSGTGVTLVILGTSGRRERKRSPRWRRDFGRSTSQWDRVGRTSQQWWDEPVTFVTSGACEVEACQTEVWQGEPKSREPTRQERGQKRAKCEPKCESSARKCELAP
ncbi:hypothetical protein V8E53_014108 [Lactarius tabidus]